MPDLDERFDAEVGVSSQTWSWTKQSELELKEAVDAGRIVTSSCMYSRCQT